MKNKILLLTIVLLVSQVAFAATVQDITAPINRIYDLIKGIISVIGIIAITIAGAMYMFSGSNIQNRENAKSMVSYAIVGLVLVWVAPLIVGYLTAPTI
jgi:RsiW-degrading membrane proteinase PrsW (M82 family)